MSLGGIDCSTSEMKTGDGSGQLVSFHRRAPRNPRCLLSIRIVETPPVKVFGESQIICLLLHGITADFLHFPGVVHLT